HKPHFGAIQLLGRPKSMPQNPSAAQGHCLFMLS
ncbi:MAG: hypothetical protein ACI9LD_001392, partial [Polaromonas sp.]